MKKLLLAGSILIALGSCKTNRNATKHTHNDSVRVMDSLREMPHPGVNEPAYDSLKHELDKKRREKNK